MKEKIKFICYIIVFVLFMFFATVGYNKLVNRNNVNEYSKEEKQNAANKPQKIKEFDVYNYNKEKINIKSLIGKPIVINIWTSWCAYCEYEMPYFNELYLKEKDNVIFMMINETGDRDRIENANYVIEKNNYSFRPYYDLDLEVIKALGIYSYPTTIFVDKDGYINSVKIGTITKEELKNRIEKIK